MGIIQLINCSPIETSKKRLAELLSFAFRLCAGPGLWEAPDFSGCVDCGSLPNPEYGVVDYDATTLGAGAAYACDTVGFELVGPALRVCQGNLTTFGWSGTEPVCQCK